MSFNLSLCSFLKKATNWGETDGASRLQYPARKPAKRVAVPKKTGF
jgi:hypothetical protein